MKRLIAIMACAALVGCSTTAPKVLPDNKPVPMPDIKPSPMTLNPVEWKVYTARDLKIVLGEMADDTVFYVLAPVQFRNLTMNLTEMERYINDQHAINDTLIAVLNSK